MNVRSTALAWGCLAAVFAAAKAEEPAQKILEKYCGKCHGPRGSNEGGINYILDAAKLTSNKKIVPGKSAASRLVKKVKAGEMPPEEETLRPSPQEVDDIAKWIDAGAKPFPVVLAKREKQTLKQTLAAMMEHLRSVPQEDQVYQRFFTLTHFINDLRVPDVEIRRLRAALSKTINSLSFKPRIVVPKLLAGGAVLAVDLRDLDWDRCHLWGAILKHYPYGLVYNQISDPETARVATELYAAAGTDLPMLRADWFIANATRPPIYHEVLFERLLELPGGSLTASGTPRGPIMLARQLEEKLNVRAIENIQRGTAARAGFITSGVSSQNRIIERHEAAFGAYWKSYDFKSNDGTGNIFRHPLGPVTGNDPHPNLAFVHDGGEAIFNLPNGMQAYLLLNGKDQRIDEGPIEVVGDSKKTSGTNKIVNGVSCMACHIDGMYQPPKDEVRFGAVAQGDARVFVQRLYPLPGKFQQLLDDDAEKFKAALQKAVGPFLEAGDSEDKTEIVGNVAKEYFMKQIPVETAAFELGLDDPAALKAAAKVHDRLRELGLTPWSQGGSIKREMWNSTTRYHSAFQEAASALDLGTPKRFR